MANLTLSSILRAGTASLALAAAIAANADTKTAPKRDLSKGNTLYVVPYAHLDTQWRWAYPQTIREFIRNTMTRNFPLFEQYPHYVFNFSGSRRYEMMKEYYPADYEKVKEYIKEGRWFPCGSSVDECDANIPSGESLVRQILYGNHYFRREFGVASEEFMLPDCFGFPYSLPSILAHCGVKGFSTQKLTWGSAVGIPFKVGDWIGPDGKSVVAALDPGSYGADISEDLSQNTSWLARIQNTGKLSGAYIDYHYYGTGDTGGAPRARAAAWVEKSIAGKGPITVVSAHADQMVKDLTPAEVAALPKYRGELLLTAHSAGSISSEGFMKRSNRKTEQLADAAERSSIAAMLYGGTPYPARRLYNAWDLLLGSQMHDMLPGTSIPKAYEFCWNDFLLSQNQFAAVERDAVGAVANELDTRGAGVHVVVYNPLSIARHDVVEATIPDLGRSRGVALRGPNGDNIPAQILSRNGGDVRIAFAADVPSTGFAAYTAHATRGRSPASDLRIDDRHLENGRFRVTVNSAGDIASIYDKRAHREVLKAPSRLELQYENPSQFPAWNMDWADAKLPPRDVVGGPAKFRVIENGPVRVALEVEREGFGSKFVQDIRLTAGGEKVEVLNNIDWQTKERALKASFPLNSGNPMATYDLQLGTTQRGNDNEKKYEVPQHQWFDLSKPDGTYGAGILNDCKFASDKPNDDTVRLTLIYTPGVRGGYEDQATQDFGRNHILYAIAPHVGDWRIGQVPWQAMRLNQPLRAFLVPAHAGPLGKALSLASASTQQVEIQAIKKAEDSDEIVVRLRELDGSAAKGVRIKFATPIVSARELNGQEQPLGPASVQNGELVTDVPGYSLKTFALTLRKPGASASEIASRPVPLPFNADVVSTSAKPGACSFAQDRAIAAEMFPSSLRVDDVDFAFGSKTDGAKNAVIAQGQSIRLPAGYSRVYVIAAADTDASDTFKVGSRTAGVTVEGWRHPIGEWDNRIWSDAPGPNFSNYGTMVGLTPGYVRPAEVAWFSSHCHTADGNTYYDYSYLYKYGFDLSQGAATLTLPNDSRVKILAISVARGCHDTAIPAAPLSDTLADHQQGSSEPLISPSSGSFNDATTVRVSPPLYWHGGSLHYTLDGSKPTPRSPRYTGPFMISDSATITVAQIDSNGHQAAAASAHLVVHDVTPASIVSATVCKSLGVADLVFSKPVLPASAENPTSYKFAGADVISAKLESDGRTVSLTFDHPIVGSAPMQASVTGIKDMARQPNVTSATVALTDHPAVFTSPELEPGAGRLFSQVKGLPVAAAAPWAVNLFCKTDAQPEDRTLIAGFGNSRDGRSGTGRYFAKFPGGINFWVCDQDVFTSVPLDLGKWQMLTATYDGSTIRLYKNGEPIAEKRVELENDRNQVRVMPIDAWDGTRRFDGSVRNLTVWDMDLSPAAIKRLWESGQAQ